jgi:single-strand DNA-binding protein
MNNLNSILIEGNVVRDPLSRHTPKGRMVCNFTIASSQYLKDGTGEAIEKEVSFVDIESWGKLAESCYNHGRKGRSVRVVGRIRQDRWTGADGKPHARFVIVAEHVEFRPEFKKETPVEIPSEEYEAEVPPVEEEVEEPAEVA